MEGVKFFKIGNDVHETYYASKSLKHFLHYLTGDDHNPYNDSNNIYYDLGTAEEISEEEAKKAPYYKDLEKKVKLNNCGTWLLGTPDNF